VCVASTMHMKSSESGPLSSSSCLNVAVDVVADVVADARTPTSLDTVEFISLY
jgi:hypothetical protein